MALALLRVLTGSVDGVNVVFQTPYPYRPGSVRIFLDGQLKREDFDDGWIELGYDKVQLKIPPESGRVVQAYFLV
jgi:hypothetical protein